MNNPGMKNSRNFTYAGRASGTARLEEAFRRRIDAGQKALITFVTAGDPDLDLTVKLVPAMAAAGADIVELGIPFSDPLADGPVIQAASARALAQGTRLPDIFEKVSEIRRQIDIPLVFLLYFNTIFQYGAERFLGDCAQRGVDGLIVPDLPPEEMAPYLPASRFYGIPFIRLVTPLSAGRIRTIVSAAEGFVYCVSSPGVTGIRSRFTTDFPAFFREVDACRRVPSALGFGISDPAQAASLKGYCDGLIVGSALVREIASSQSDHDAALQGIIRLTGAFRKALDKD